MPTAFALAAPVQKPQCQFVRTHARDAIAPAPTQRGWRRTRARTHQPVMVAPGSASSSGTGPRTVPLAPLARDIWELDFYSRPVVGSDGKKLWELIITDSLGTFEHVEAIPNSLVNSAALRGRIEAVICEASVRPTTVRFFRTQMRNMITIALEGTGVEVRPSRRTYALRQVIKYSENVVYPAMPGYRKPVPLPEMPTMPGMPLSGVATARPLPDELRCDSFAFVIQPLGIIEEFFEQADRSEFFGDKCLVAPDISPDALVPGLLLYSRRAASVAGWMSGIELAAISVKEYSILLECGIDTRFRFGEVDKRIRDEARSFEKGKSGVEGLHILAVMKNAQVDQVEGMWLVCDSL